MCQNESLFLQMHLLISSSEVHKPLLLQALNSLLEACFQRDVVDTQTLRLLLGNLESWHEWLVIGAPVNPTAWLSYSYGK